MFSQSVQNLNSTNSCFNFSGRGYRNVLDCDNWVRVDVQGKVQNQVSHSALDQVDVNVCPGIEDPTNQQLPGRLGESVTVLRVVGEINLTSRDGGGPEFAVPFKKCSRPHMFLKMAFTYTSSTCSIPVAPRKTEQEIPQGDCR